MNKHFINLKELERWPIFVSFFTLDTGYELEVQNLLNSLIKHNLPYHVEGLKSLDNWVKNCAMKPAYIRKLMNIYQSHPLVWLDADAVVNFEPTLFLNANIDTLNSIMCGYLQPELLSGTIYIKNDDQAKRVITMWDTEQSKNNNIWDQKVLQKIQQKHTSAFSFLPFSYIKIYDNSRMTLKENETAVIVHNQASRRFKNTL